MKEIISHDKIETEKIELISLKHFVFLCIITFGLYDIWWIFKAWKFFKDKDDLNILPVLRCLLSIFYLHALFVKIWYYSKSKGNSKRFSPILSYMGLFTLSLLAYLPYPFWLVTYLSFYFLIPAFESLNFGIRNSVDYIVIESDSFNPRQIMLILVGGIFWALFIWAYFIP
ncbi:MAG: hypothetical protein IIA45_08260 [Bacteroidetes bacterium]|nr:hypothetical protein [Bacteroidota bacterium]